jgi:hypothetical protein
MRGSFAGKDRFGHGWPDLVFKTLNGYYRQVSFFSLSL